MTDLLDFLREKSPEVLTGTYYSKMPTQLNTGEEFTYEQVNPNYLRYSKVLNSVEAPVCDYAIKTDDAIDFKINGYIATQEGGFWQIVSVDKNIVNDETKEALRFLFETVKTSKLIRLINIENPKNLK